MLTGKDKYHLLLDNMPHAFAYHQVITDNNGNPVDYKFLDINPAFEEMIGHSRKDVIGHKVTEVLPKIKTSAFDWIGTYQVASSKKSIRFDSYFEPTESYYDITAYSDEPGYFAVIFHNITEHKKMEKTFMESEFRGRQAQEILRENEERLKQILSSIDMGITIVDVQTHQIIDANQKALDMFNAPAKDVIGKVCHRYICPAEEGCCPITDLNHTIDYSSEKTLITAQGISIPIIKSVVRTHLSGRDCLIESFLDITEHKKNEAALRESEEKHRTLFETMTQGVTYQDAKGNIISANPAAERILGLTLSQMQGRTSFDPRWRAIREDGSDFSGETHPAMMALQTGKEVRNVVMGVFNPQYSGYRWININATPNFKPGEKIPFQVYTTFEDITDLKKAMEDTQKSEAQLQKIFDILPIGLWFADKDGTLLRGNAAGQKIWGDEPLVGKEEYGVFKARRLPSGEEIAPHDWALAHTVNKGISIMDEMLEIEAFDGTKKIILNYTAPVMDEQGNIQGAIVVNHDITQHKLSEEQVHKNARFLDTLLNTIKNPIYYKDRDGRYTGCNKAFEKYMGLSSSSEIIGKTVFDIKSPNNAQIYYEKDKILLETPGTQTYDIEVMQSDGTLQHVIFNKAALVGVDNEVEGIVGVITDITERKQAEMALQKLEYRYRTISRLSTDFAYSCILSHEGNYRVDWISDAFFSLTGYTEDELREMGCWMVTAHPHDRDKAMEPLMQLKVGESDSREFRIITKPGEVLVVANYMECTSDAEAPGGLRMYGAVEDITVRKKAEQEERMNITRLKSLLAIGQYPATSTQDLLDYALAEAIKLTASKVGYIYYYDEVNKEFTLNSWSKDVMKECSVRDPQDTYQLYKTGIWGEAVRQRKPVIVNDFASSNPLKKGYPKGHVRLTNFMTIPVFKGESIIAVVGVANKDQNYEQKDVLQLTLLMDSVWKIVERKESEKILAESERRYALVVNNLPKGVVHIMDREFRYVFNAGDELNKLGLSDKDLKGKTIFEILSPKTAQAVKGYYQRAFTGETVTYTITYKGQVFLSSVVPLTIDEGVVEHLLVLQVNITEQKRAERKLRELNRELDKIVQKRTAQLKATNQELEAFAYSVSHDLRSPLRAVTGFANILLEDYSQKLDPEGMRILHVICDNTHNMDQLITDLLELSRTTRTQIKHQAVDMTALVNLTYNESSTSDVRDTFSFSLNPLPAVVGDRSLLRQVWQNLLDNAIKYSIPKKDRKIIINGYTEKDVNIYWIEDRGVGFNPKYKAKIFETFQRLHNSQEFPGTGIGLSIVQRIIHRHGGKVWAEGAIDEGAAFYFSLPTKGENIDEQTK